MKDDNIIKRKEDLIILLSIIKRTDANVLCMNWFCEEDSIYISQELSKIEKRILEVDSKLLDIYKTILKSIDSAYTP